MDDLNARRELFNGFGDGLARAFEMALTPALFGAGGFGLDRWLGLFPTFTLILGTFGVVGMFIRTWYAYSADMSRAEAGRPWTRGIAAPPAVPANDPRRARSAAPGDRA